MSINHLEIGQKHLYGSPNMKSAIRLTRIENEEYFNQMEIIFVKK
jgi:hypothetical protein